MTIRKAHKSDAQAIFDLIWELAEFEKGSHLVTNTPEKIIQDGFSDNPIFQCLVAEIEGKVVGISLYYFRYSTWKGKILYLEDLVVKESHRNKGIGKALLDKTIEEAQETNSVGMRWQVLDWNTPAIEFYKNYPVQFDGEWLNVDWTF